MTEYIIRRLSGFSTGVIFIAMLAGCEDESGGMLFVEPVAGPAPMAPEIIMDASTPFPGFPMSFPDGVSVFREGGEEFLLFNEANRQRRIELNSINRTLLVHSVALERASDGGRDANGQICRDAEGNYVFGEDTGQSGDPQTHAFAGWGVFNAAHEQVGKLTPTSISTENQSEPFGCALARDGTGRLFTSEVGSQRVGASSGQLLLWFPHPENGFRVWPGNVPASEYPNSNFSDNYCKLATDLSTAASVAVDKDGNVYVANSGNGTVVVFRPPFPTAPTAEGGCSGTDGVSGAPMVDPGLGDPLQREVFIASGELFSPSGLVQSPRTGNWYVAGVFDGKILEYSPDGTQVLQVILDPANNIPPESPFSPGGLPLSSGHPYGLALDAEGTLYFTDMQLSGTLPSVGPAGGQGKLRRIQFQR